MPAKQPRSSHTAVPSFWCTVTAQPLHRSTHACSPDEPNMHARARWTQEMLEDPHRMASYYNA